MHICIVQYISEKEKVKNENEKKKKNEMNEMIKRIKAVTRTPLNLN